MSRFFLPFLIFCLLYLFVSRTNCVDSRPEGEQLQNDSEEEEAEIQHAIFEPKRVKVLENARPNKEAVDNKIPRFVATQRLQRFSRFHHSSDIQPLGSCRHRAILFQMQW
jgi:hypothetical protein